MKLIFVCSCCKSTEKNTCQSSNCLTIKHVKSNHKQLNIGIPAHRQLNIEGCTYKSVNSSSSSIKLCINKRIKPRCFNKPIYLLKTIVVQSVDNLIVCKDGIMKLYNRAKQKG